MWSVIVFSDRCTLKNIQTTGKNIAVMNRCDVARFICGIYDKMPNDHPNLQPEKPKPTSLAFKKGFSDGYAYGIQVLRKNKLIENCNV